MSMVRLPWPQRAVSFNYRYIGHSPRPTLTGSGRAGSGPSWCLDNTSHRTRTNSPTCPQGDPQRTHLRGSMTPLTHKDSWPIENR